MSAPPRSGAQTTGAPMELARSLVGVLVVNDNPAKRLALKSALAPLGYQIVEADSGPAALRAVLAQDFAVILLDVRMPGMDGFETAAMIRRRSKSEMTPIIFVTASASDEIDENDRYVEGAVDFIFSPVQPAEIRAKVSAFADLHRNAAELATRARQSQVTADELRLLTDAAPIGIFRTDDENRYVYTNPHWSWLTGISAESAIGRAWDSLLDADQRAEFATEHPDGAGGASGLDHRFELGAPGPGSGSRHLLLTARPIRPSEEFGGWVGTLSDVTAEVEAARAREEQLKSKDQFLSHVSHELRSPLAVVHQFASLLADGVGGPLTDDQGEFLAVVTRNIAQLKVMIDDLLAVSRSGLLTVECKELALGSELVEATAGFIWAAKNRQVALSLEYGDLPTVFADGDRLQEVLANVLDNALKFTARGGQIVVDAVTKNANVVVSVRDTGRGIPATAVERIFDQFYQVDHDGEESRNGLGLGLFICRDLIERQGGSIWAESIFGSGTTVFFTLLIHAQHDEIGR